MPSDRIRIEVAGIPHLHFQNDPDDFRFAVVGDRTGGHRTGAFPAAVDVLNLLRPEFVMSVGDFIEGYVEDEAALRSMWKEIDDSLNRLEMPLFFVMGNHDVNLDPSETVWFDRVAASWGYSHFVYKNVLFLMMSTDDPPKKDPGPEFDDKYQRVKAGNVTPEEGRAIVEELEAWAGKVNISDAQVAYFKEVLAANADVRWTFGFLHTPAWAQPDPGNFTKIEALLAERPHTMFAGHTHTYDHTRPAQLEKLMQDPNAANEQLGGGKVEAGFQQSYREFVSLPSAQREFRKLFLALGDPDQLPALFHCTTGKDRTGWAAAALLTLLGVPKDQVMEDYLRSNEYIIPAYKHVIDLFVEAGGDPAIPEAILGVKREYLEAAFDEMETMYGTIDNYFAEGLGIDADQQKSFRKLYLKKQ